MSRSEERDRRAAGGTRRRSGSTSSTTLVVSGTTRVEGCPARSNACAWTIRTGRVLPGSVPCRGLRSASQISPRLGVRVSLDRCELGIDLHALLADLLGRCCETLRAEAGVGMPIHAFDGATDVGSTGDAQRLGAAAARVQQLLRQLQRDRFHGATIRYPTHIFPKDTQYEIPLAI